MEKKTKLIYDRIVEDLWSKCEGEIKALIAYGSHVCAKPTKSSMFDLWCIVYDYEKFYKKFFKFRKYFPPIWPFTEEGQIFLNRSTRLNYYRDEIKFQNSNFKIQISKNPQSPIPNPQSPVSSRQYAVNSNQSSVNGKPLTVNHEIPQSPILYKYAVMSLDDFIYTCTKSKKLLVVKGKFQKPVEIIYCDGDRTPIENAINAARQEAVVLSLKLLEPEFSLDELLRKIVELSYMADFRPESSKKIDEIYKVSYNQLKSIYLPIIEGMEALEKIHSAPIEKAQSTEHRTQNTVGSMQSAITNHKSQITNHNQSPITNHQMVERASALNRYKNLNYDRNEKEKTKKYLKDISRFSLLLNLKGFFNFGPIDSIAYVIRKLGRAIK